MIDKEETFKKLYTVFSKYTRPSRVIGSPISVNPDADIKLTTKPLKSLSKDDLNEYEFKAMTTWGTAEDFKYFLPAILEANFYSFNWGADIFFGKIYSAACHEDDEQNVLAEYMLAMWEDASKLPWPDLERIEALIDNLDSFIPNEKVNPLVENWIKEWAEHEHIEAFEKLVSYINFNWIEVLYQNKPHHNFLDIVLASSFQERLQKSFFEYEKTRPKFANIISSCEKHIFDYLSINSANK
jgi:hypothetical protein